MSWAALFFYLLAFVVVGSAVMVVTRRNVFHSALFLVLCLFGVAGIYVMLSAEFLAAIQILLYVGAVAVLMIFAILLTAQIDNEAIRQVNKQVWPAFLLVSVLLSVTTYLVVTSKWRAFSPGTLPENTEGIGRALLTTYVVPFEVVSIVLLMSLIGALVLARRATTAEEETE
jgi:NADH:ubiquinone oxidoreductase subunit 6 (subunit J)